MLLSIIPLLILGAISNYTANAVINKEIGNLSVQLMSEKTNHLEMFAEEIESLIANVSGVDDIKNAIKSPNSQESGYNNLATQAKIGYILSNYKNIKGLVSLDIFTKGGSHYHVGDTLDIKQIDTELLNRLYEEAEVSGESIYWAGIEDNVNLNSQTEKVITTVKLIKMLDEDTYQEKIIGLLMVNYDVNTLYQMFHDNTDQGMHFVIVDGKNRIVYYDDILKIGTAVNAEFLSQTSIDNGSFSWNINGEDSLVTFERSKLTNWRLINYMPKNYIVDKTRVINHATMWVLLFCFIVVGLIAYVFTVSIVIPVKSVTNQFVQIRHGLFDMSTRLPINRQDEIGELNQGFNTFVDTLEEINRNQEDLRVAKEAAESANRLKDEFLANVSHEIRTPMNAIVGYTSMLKDHIQDENGQKYLNSILKAGNTLVSLINDILDISKIEVGKIELNVEQFRIRRLIDEIQSVFLWSVQEKGIALNILIDPEIPEVMLMDEMRTRQILFNLIGNAVKFTDHGMVEVSVKMIRHQEMSDKVDLEIAVNDTGIGIPSDQQLEIFEPFKQMNGQSNKRYGGTGLGLSISKRLTEIMGGTITLSSEPMYGSTFTVTIPEITVVQYWNESTGEQSAGKCEYRADNDSVTAQDSSDLTVTERLDQNPDRADDKLIEHLEALYTGLWETCRRGNRINDLRELSIQLHEIGDRFKYGPLIAHADELMTSVNGYHSGRIRENLNKFPVMMDSLRNTLQ